MTGSMDSKYGASPAVARPRGVLREEEKTATATPTLTITNAAIAAVNATPAKSGAAVAPATPSFGAQPTGNAPSAPNSAALPSAPPPSAAATTSSALPRRTPRGYAQLSSTKRLQQQQTGSLVPPSTGAGAPAAANSNPYALSAELGHRFRTILEESVERLQLLGLITADAGRRRDVPSKANRKDIFSLMLNQRQLEESYAELMTRKNQLRGLSNKSKLAQVMEDLKELTDALKDSSTTISQTLKDQPTSTGNIAKIQRDRSELQSLLEKTIIELSTGVPATSAAASATATATTPNGASAGVGSASVPVFHTLVEQVTAGHIRRDLLPKAELRRKQLKDELAEYDTKLAQQKHRFDEELKELNARIQEETRQLKTFREESEASYRFERASLLAKAEQVGRVRKQKLDGLGSELDLIADTRELDMIVTQRNNEHIEKRQKELDALTHHWGLKHAREGKEMDDALDRLMQARAKDQIKLRFLQKREEKEIAFNNARDAELSRRRLEADKRAAMLAIQNRAHLKIRFAWRVYHKKAGTKKKKRKIKKKVQPAVPTFVNREPRERKTAASVAAQLKASARGADGGANAAANEQTQNGIPLGSIAARALAVASAQAAASAAAATAANSARAAAAALSGGPMTPTTPAAGATASTPASNR